jgi:hypothetical protein
MALSLRSSAAPARASRAATRASPRDMALLSAAASAALLLVRGGFSFSSAGGALGRSLGTPVHHSGVSPRARLPSPAARQPFLPRQTAGARIILPATLCRRPILSSRCRRCGGHGRARDRWGLRGARRPARARTPRAVRRALSPLPSRLSPAALIPTNAPTTTTTTQKQQQAPFPQAALAKLPDGIKSPSLAAQEAVAPSASDKAQKLFSELESKPLPSAPATEESKPRASALLQPSAPAVATPPSAASSAPAASSTARPTLAAEAKADGPSPLVIVGALGVLGAGAAFASNSNSAEVAAAAPATPPPAAAAAPPAEPSAAPSDSTGAQ